MKRFHLLPILCFMALSLTSVAQTSTSPAAATAPAAPTTIMKYFVSVYPEYRVLVKSINSTQLNATFESTDNPVTVFAPVNKTFVNAKAGAIKNILKPQMNDSLKSILTHMVVSGSWDLAKLTEKIKEGAGSFSLPSVGGTGNLTFLLKDNYVWVKDDRGTLILLKDPIKATNGLIYSVDRLLLP